jgi:DNA-binding beta-propeller fold protein YncE
MNRLPLCWLCVTTTDFARLKATWAVVSAQPLIEAILLPASAEADGGGCVLLLDFEARAIVRSVPLPRATSIFAPTAGELAVSAFDRLVVLDAELRVSRVATSPVFNDLHGGTPVPDGLAVTSSGVDAVVLLDHHWNVARIWKAPEWGFAHVPRGAVRRLDYTKDHRRWYYPVHSHTSHPNAVRWDPIHGDLLIALFHQGSVVAWDLDQRLITLVSGLSCPHTVIPTPDGRFLTADTRNGRALVWDRDGDVEYIPVPNCHWLQDVKPITRDTFLACDGGSSRLIHMRYDGEQLDTWQLPPEWRLGELLPVL